jgi:hypothetical protein
VGVLNAREARATPWSYGDSPVLSVRDQADRDAISSALMRYRDEDGQRWADLIDFLTMYPDARRRVVRTLGALGAPEG